MALTLSVSVSVVVKFCSVFLVFVAKMQLEGGLTCMPTKPVRLRPFRRRKPLRSPKRSGLEQALPGVFSHSKDSKRTGTCGRYWKVTTSS